MKSDEEGFHHVGHDGILRSFNRNGKVIDYYRLDEKQLLAIGNEIPQQIDYLEHLSANANSSKVYEDAIWSPTPTIPTPSLKHKTKRGLIMKREPPPPTPRPDRCQNYGCASGGPGGGAVASLSWSPRANPHPIETIQNSGFLNKTDSKSGFNHSQPAKTVVAPKDAKTREIKLSSHASTKKP
ncbi:uncharacterized protein PADG_08392 [Paracoccidioides brasiliensis Pb18]|uniref:Uncharacterized protein n=1 Tax=Paracoccidioides brasiliensis (strain Pb18) TaxID=502780 RepID=C1GM01_PARBD|nr:uncharacterized protein PADG_08392 [Paracoccidioides brasiliensis Pb18]EEH43467.1 hypothetical protein PADG_08392 [Paracoccidioides brasiliensis Pb18]